MNKVLTSALLKGLEAAKKVNKTMGKLSTDWVTVSVEGNTMTVNSVDFVNQIILTIPVEESQDFLVGIAELEKLVKAIKKFDLYTTFEFDGENILISDGKKKLKLITVDKYDIKQVSKNNPFTVSGLILENAYSKVKKSIAKEESRLILCGVHFKNNFIETIDGYRVSQIKISQDYFNHDFIVHPKALEIILPVAKKDKLDVTIDISENRCVMTTGNKDYTLTVLGGLYEGEFLNTDRVFTDDYEYCLSFSENKAIVSELEFIKDMTGVDSTTNKPLPIKYLIDENKLTISSDKETTTSEVEFDKAEGYFKDTFKIAFNPNYMLDAIKNISGAFTMQFISHLTPCIIKNEEERYLVLPVRMTYINQNINQNKYI